MRRTNIYLTDRQCTQLDKRARAERVSRAAVIRQLLDECLMRDTADLDHDLEALDASFGALSGDAIEFARGTDERTRHLEQIARG